MTLVGQVGLVTGGGRGIGRALALGLAAQGVTVVLVARTEVELAEVATMIRERGGKAVPVVADVTDPAAVQRVIAGAIAESGVPDLLVNNAGTAAAIGPMWEVDPDEWWRDIETSLRGSFLVSREVLPAMLERGSGRVVNVASYVGVRPSPYLSGYGAAKAALVNLTESLAAEVEDTAIRVFAITPGHVRTKLVERMLSTPAGRRWLTDVPRSEPLEAELAVKLLCELASGRLDALHGRFLHVLDDLGDLVARLDEVEEKDLLVPRLRH